MNIRDWLHLIGIHHWGKWSEAKEIEIDAVFVRTIFGQERYCQICNRKRIRKIK